MLRQRGYTLQQRNYGITCLLMKTTIFYLSYAPSEGLYSYTEKLWHHMFVNEDNILLFELFSVRGAMLLNGETMASDVC